MSENTDQPFFRHRYLKGSPVLFKTGNNTENSNKTYRYLNAGNLFTIILNDDEVINLDDYELKQYEKQDSIVMPVTPFEYSKI